MILLLQLIFWLGVGMYLVTALALVLAVIAVATIVAILVGLCAYVAGAGPPPQAAPPPERVVLSPGARLLAADAAAGDIPARSMLLARPPSPVRDEQLRLAGMA